MNEGTRGLWPKQLKVYRERKAEAALQREQALQWHNDTRD
jgi:hypothetical protein